MVGLTSVAPALAASFGPTVTGTVCQLFYGGGTINYQTHSIYFGVTSSSGVIPAGTVVSWTVCVDPSTNPEGAPDWSLPTREYPIGTSQTATNGPWYFSYETVPVAPATTGTPLAIGTARTGAQCFVVKVTFNSNYTGNFCAAIVWNDTFTLRPASTITITGGGLVSGPAQDGGSMGLKYKSARRYPTAINTTGRLPHYYLSKSGNQTCYPPVQYSRLLSTNGADNVTCYPTGTPSITSPCTWGGTTCGGTTGTCTPKWSSTAASGQYTSTVC